MENVAVLPLAREATVQVTVPPTALHAVGAETKVNPLGSESVTITSLAGLGPLLRTVSVKVTWSPGCAVAAEANLASSRSAAGITSVSIVSAALAGSGSSSFESTRAPLATTVPAAELPKVPVIAIVSAPSATVRAGRVQTSVPPAAGRLQVNPGAAIALGVNEAGRGSTTRTLFALSGPVFRTVSV
jgi:hypothetical protein